MVDTKSLPIKKSRGNTGVFWEIKCCHCNITWYCPDQLVQTSIVWSLTNEVFFLCRKCTQYKYLYL